MVDADELVTFQVKVNDGPQREIKVKSGIYVEAVAAVPALLGDENEYPMMVEIWVENLLPDYGPYTYYIEAAGRAVGKIMTINGEKVSVTS